MSTIFNLTTPSPKAKVHITLGTLPPYTSTSQPPTKKPPWRTITSTPFISSLSLTLPNTLLTHLPLPPPPAYTKLLVPLPTLLTGAFFNRYIKTGNIILISEGRPGIDDWMATLHEGTLRVEMSRDVYERAGMQGHPADRNGGARKHGRDRWVVEAQLRAPAMVGGKKGYERLLKAAERAWGDGRVWLFRDLGGGGEETGEELKVLHPIVVEMGVERTEVKGVLVPEMVTGGGIEVKEFQEEYFEVVEWLDMVRLGSEQVLEGDETDPFISRYEVPDGQSDDLTVITWSGLLDSRWCIQLLLDVIRQSRKSNTRDWVAVTINSQRTEALGQVDGALILLQPFAKNELSDSMDTTMGEDQEAISAGTKGKPDTSGGLHHYMCFEFVDTVNAY